MGITYTIRLEENDLGQLLDGLRNRSEAWHDTASFLSIGHGASDDAITEECSNPDEARQIAESYDRIIAAIKNQMRTQKSIVSA